MRLSIIGLLVTFGICLLWVPTVSHAQQPAKIPRIGMLLALQRHFLQPSVSRRLRCAAYAW
jgi:hypothetical protein